MRKLYGLAILLCLPLLSYGQARNTGVRLKGPLYQDEVLLITRNLLQVRVEAPFYAYSYVNETYKDKPSTPLLLGLRYERLIKSKFGFGMELEYTSYQAKIQANARPYYIPWDQQIVKFTPHIRFYFRSQKMRKQIFRGFHFSVGPTLLAIQQEADISQYPRLSAPNADSSDIFRFNPATIFGVSIAAGYQHTFGHWVTAGISAEGIFCGDQFKQETYYRTDIGNGAFYINPFKLYIGARF